MSVARTLSLSEGKVPYLPLKRIEREADLLLAEYAEILEAITAPPVPIEELPGAVLPVTFEFLDMQALFPFADVHGAIWFEEARIGIDARLHSDEHPNRRGRYHFTLAHEIGHWRLHREYYLKNRRQQQLFEDGTRRPDVVCRSSERKQSVEWQADQFAACLLMPRKLVYDVWPEFHGGGEPVSLAELNEHFPEFGIEPVFHRGRILVTEEEKDEALKEMFCKPLADSFAVSAEAMKYRLEELGLLVKEKSRMLF